MEWFVELSNYTFSTVSFEMRQIMLNAPWTTPKT